MGESVSTMICRETYCSENFQSNIRNPQNMISCRKNINNLTRLSQFQVLDNTLLSFQWLTWNYRNYRLKSLFFVSIDLGPVLFPCMVLSWPQRFLIQDTFLFDACYTFVFAINALLHAVPWLRPSQCVSQLANWKVDKTNTHLLVYFTGHLYIYIYIQTICDVHVPVCVCCLYVNVYIYIYMYVYMYRCVNVYW